MTRKWLAESWEVLIPALAVLGVAQEDEVMRLCQATIAGWKARPDIKLNSLRVPMTETRNELKRALPVNEATRWLDPKSGKWLHIALKHFNFSEGEWVEMNAPSAEAFQLRLENQQLIADPDAIVATASHLLDSERWEDIALGLAVVTGRRLTELLKVGQFFPKTRYTVLFDGQLKRRDMKLQAYEIPTLVAADRVVAGLHTLRGKLDCSKMDVEQVSKTYSGIMGENATRHFAALVPQAEGESLHTHMFRAIYGRIAVLWYCPPTVADLTYMAAISGHYKLLEAETETERRNHAATAHYFDFKIATADGQVDGRQGIKLGTPGVELLEVFQKKEGTIMSETETQEAGLGALTLEKKSKTGFSALRPKQETKDRIDKVLQAKGMRSHDEVLVYLLDTEVEAQRMRQALASLPQSEALSDLLTDVSASEHDVVAYLKNLVEKDRRFKAAMAQRHTDTDYTVMPMAQLERLKTPEAAQERFKRAVDAIIAHNLAQTEPLRRWYVNAAAVRDLVGGRNEAVQAYLQSRQQELDEHHALFSLTPRQNRKPSAITDDITEIA